MSSEKLSASLSNISFAFCLECSSIHKTFHSKTVDASCVNKSLSAWQTLLDYYVGYDEQGIPGVSTFADLISLSGIFHSAGAWNDVMTPLVIMSGSENTTLPLAQLNFQTQFGTNYNLAFASYLLALLPILILYIFCQKQIIGGVANGAVKG